MSMNYFIIARKDNCNNYLLQRFLVICFVLSYVVAVTKVEQPTTRVTIRTRTRKSCTSYAFITPQRVSFLMNHNRQMQSAVSSKLLFSNPCPNRGRGNMHISLSNNNNNDNINNSSNNKNRNFFDSINDFLNQFHIGDGLSLNNYYNNNRKNYNKDNDQFNNDEMMSGEDSNGTTMVRLVTIPTKDVKLGGLRLFLMLYLMGMQNTPEQNTWRAHQPDTTRRRYRTSTTNTDATIVSPINDINNKSIIEEQINEQNQNENEKQKQYNVEFIYYDQSAMLYIELMKHEINIHRIVNNGMSTVSSPSNSYIMQEAVIMEGLLNEMEQCANDNTIPISSRLLILQDSNLDAITRAKEALAFG